ncbi:ATP-binding protein [Segetibacter sp.]|jgi:SpoVK/Ycf46/Vps4 family AAA+-type ATPase|uniref:ATP-binding protein n=1 Tax=Segetibacter sp. TaxID=2231182 RepID=UPI00262C6DAC|nr:ATP-binding protein [Segetibacter sp.]MCW3080382.1 ftsH2 2 [Segetibacter sp.]
MEQLNELTTWLKQNKLAKQNSTFGNQEAHVVLFSGTATSTKLNAVKFIATESNKEVQYVDSSKVVRKYIGETEKNIKRIFASAESKGWILFFDEADALFGKRTDVKNAHDKYANLEVSYLLQCLEEFHGLIILSAHSKAALDTAFIRRIRHVVRFTNAISPGLFSSSSLK